MTHVEVTILVSSLAGRQDGVVSRRQLIASGVSSNQVESRVRNRFLKKLYAGVYAVGHDRLSLQGRQRAAVMAGGPNAVLSHRAAATLLGLLPPTSILEVIRSSSPDPHQPPPEHASRAIHPGLIIHRTRSLRPGEITKRYEIPVTSPVRTVINLAERETAKTLDLAIRRGIARKLFSLDELNRAVDQARGRKGIAKLRRVLEGWNPAKLMAKSGLEILTADVFPAVGVPHPLINDFRCGYEIDFQWKGSSILVEADGDMYHLSRADRHRDYRKMLDLQAAGNTVLRVDEEMVEAEALEVGLKIRKLLEEEGIVELQPISPQPVAVSDRAPP